MLTELVAPDQPLLLYPTGGGNNGNPIILMVDSFGPITSGRQRSGSVYVRGSIPVF
jgi:hypothetical protein